jgi:hypothetical protein
MARSVMYRFGDGTKEWHAQATATFFFPSSGKLPPGVAVNKINIHSFTAIRFLPCALLLAGLPTFLFVSTYRLLSLIRFRKGVGPVRIHFVCL